MKKVNACALFLAGLLATQAVPAQEAAANLKGLPVQTIGVISDDDGGVVQVVSVGLTSTRPTGSNTTPLMKSIHQVSVFLGSAWGQQNLRGREASLWDLSGEAHVAQLHTQNVAVLPASPSVEDFADLKAPVNDLTMQTKLVDMLESKTLPAPDASTVFVVFLAPDVKLTVGNHAAGADFAAYHNLIHVAAGELRYVVVPFNENVNNHATAASLAIVDTVFNPASH